MSSKVKGNEAFMKKEGNHCQAHDLQGSRQEGQGHGMTSDLVLWGSRPSRVDLGKLYNNTLFSK